MSFAIMEDTFQAKQIQQLLYAKKTMYTWKNQFFNTFLIRVWIEKTLSANQDLAKSWKNQIFNTFLNRIWIEKSIHQNQDFAKSWKNQFFNTF